MLYLSLMLVPLFGTLMIFILIYETEIHYFLAKKKFFFMKNGVSC